MTTYSNESGAGFVAGGGVRFRQAREAAGLSVDEVAARLHMPVQVVRRLESDDWSSLGAPVFVRGQVRSYARLLGLDAESLLDDGAVGVIRPSQIVSHAHVPAYRRVFEQFTRRAIYIVLTAAIAVPVWFGARPALDKGVAVESLDVVPEQQSTASAPAVARPAPERTPVIASMAAVPAKAAPSLALSFSGDSWLEVSKPDGSSLESGIMKAGDTRAYGAGEVGRIVIGNIAAAQLQQSGRSVDLAPFSRANVARFTLSSDGSLSPVAD